MVELALCLPILLILTTGIFSLGIFFNQYMQLADAVSVGAKLLAVQRGNTVDPCSLVSTAIANAAPSLNAANITYSIALKGSSGTSTYTGTTCSSVSNTTGAAANLVQGNPIQVTATYPCSLAIYGSNLVPNCVITAQLTELEQ